jgi:YVTN family beta-propeller protein
MKNLKKTTRMISLIIVLVGIMGFIFLPSPNRIPSNSSPKNINIDSPGLAFICHITHSTVTVIDLKTNKIVDTLQAGSGTDWFTLSKDRKTAYVANFQSNNITIIDAKDTKKSGSVPMGKNPISIYLTADEQIALISHQSQDGLWFMNTATHQITKRISEGTGLLRVLKNGSKIYQPGIFRPYIHIIDPDKQAISKSIYVGGRPLNIDFTPDGKYAYVTNSDQNEVEVIDTKTDSVINKISGIDVPRGIAITPDGKYALVTNVSANMVTIIEVKNNSVLKKLSVDKMPTDIAITKDGKYAYVTNQGSASIAIISIGKLEVVNNIEVADNPISIHLYD